jgi:hypothetical protein
MILFMSELAVISFRAQFPKRSVHGGLTRYKTASPNRKLLCPKGLRKAADPPVRDRIGEHPPSNQSLTSAPQGLGRTSHPALHGRARLPLQPAPGRRTICPFTSDEHKRNCRPLRSQVDAIFDPHRLSSLQ